MAELSEWLQIMLGEVGRKHEEQSRASRESAARAAEAAARGAGQDAPADSEAR